MKTNRLISLAASLLIATAASAQKPQFLGAGHAIIKVDTQKKYLLIIQVMTHSLVGIIIRKR